MNVIHQRQLSRLIGIMLFSRYCVRVKPPF
nr:MAG TPA: hypothetical protein [Caudoviricetes sp.]DAK19503.1 MAG TPA: hypothetical protein [Caudoviricetes sp.]DAY91696.1 MAG TPA: hypothetical protein [Caudoviricetes sp.]